MSARSVDNAQCGRGEKMRYNMTRRILEAIRAPMTAIMLFGFVACDTDELLEVDLPGIVPEEALDDPLLAATLVASVISDTECAWDNYVAAAANHSDEYIESSGNLTMRNWGLRWIPANDPNYSQGTCEGWGYGLYTPLHTARFQAEDIYARLGTFGADVTNVGGLQATVRAYGGYSLMALGEGFCEMALDVGPLMTPAEVLTLAESRFSEAIQLAGASRTGRSGQSGDGWAGPGAAQSGELRRGDSPMPRPSPKASPTQHPVISPMPAATTPTVSW